MNKTLHTATIEELQAEIARKKRISEALPVTNLKNGYDSPLGMWHVTTEGDCEGRTTLDLGYHEGHIVDIAYGLADKCCYSLQFSRVKPDQLPKAKQPKNIKSVSISLNIDSGTWDREMNGARRASSIDYLLKKSPSKVPFVGAQEGQYYAAVNLVFKH
jgi:hypothetical protein